MVGRIQPFVVMPPVTLNPRFISRSLLTITPGLKLEVELHRRHLIHIFEVFVKFSVVAPHCPAVELGRLLQLPVSKAPLPIYDVVARLKALAHEWPSVSLSCMTANSCDIDKQFQLNQMILHETHLHPKLFQY